MSPAGWPLASDIEYRIWMDGMLGLQCVWLGYRCSIDAEYFALLFCLS